MRHRQRTSTCITHRPTSLAVRAIHRVHCINRYRYRHQYILTVQRMRWLISPLSRNVLYNFGYFCILQYCLQVLSKKTERERVEIERERERKTEKKEKERTENWTTHKRSGLQIKYISIYIYVLVPKRSKRPLCKYMQYSYLEFKWKETVNWKRDKPKKTQ